MDQLKSKISLGKSDRYPCAHYYHIGYRSRSAAQALAEEVAKTSSDYIGDIMEMVPPKIIEEGVPAEKPSSPNVKKNAAMGGLAAAVLISGIICLGVILDDTIKTEEDVEKYLGLTVLASIPDVDETGKSENEKGRKKEENEGSGVKMEMRLELKNTERNDYYYEEAIKTLRTNIQFCGSSLKIHSLYKYRIGRRKKRYYSSRSFFSGKYREKGSSGRRGYPQIRTGEAS